MSNRINLTTILELDPSFDYEIEDVREIKLSDGIYYASVILTRYQSGRGEYIFRKVSVEFLWYLRIGAWIKKNKILRNPDWIEVELKASDFDNLQYRRSIDSKYLAPEYCTYHFKNTKKNGVRLYEEKEYNKSICYYEFAESIVINGKKVNYITFPSFEIARFFLLGTKKFNESLIITDIEHSSRLNKIYNPKHTGLYKLNGQKHEYVCLRKEIEDDNASTAGNIAFRKEYRKLVANFQRDIQVGQSQFRNPFSLMKIPWSTLIGIKCLGVFTFNTNKKPGISISVIEKQSSKNATYFFGRDNPGVRTINYDAELKESYSGRLKSKRSKINSKPIEEIEKSPASNSIELEEASFYSEFESESNESIKLLPVDQNFQAAKKLPPENKEPKGYGVSSINSNNNSTLQGVSLKNLSDNDFICAEDYWESFPELLTKISDISGIKLSFYTGDELTQNKSTYRFHFTSGKSLFMVGVYVVVVSHDNFHSLLVELDQTDIESFTLVFPYFGKKSDPNQKLLESINAISEEIIKQNGGFFTQKIDQDSILIKQKVKRFSHIYHKRNSDYTLFEQKEAIEIYQQKVLNYIREL